MKNNFYLLCIKLLQFIIRCTWDSASTLEYTELMNQCKDFYKKELIESHDWHCGCGHWNGCNLATCAMCGRTPSESYPIKEK